MLIFVSLLSSSILSGDQSAWHWFLNLPILSSSSPRRIQILRNLGIDFLIKPPYIEEEILKQETPREFAVRCSRDKAQIIAENEQGIIIAADTIVVLDNMVIGKPEDKKHAVEILTKLSGRKHTVITGINIIDTKNSSELSDYEET